MPFVEIRTTLPDHRKAKAMAREVGMRRPWVVGHLVCLWAWALENVPSDGSLAGIDQADLEEAAQWPEERAGELLPAMVAAGFVDHEAGAFFIHDWDTYAGRLLRRREEDRARKAAERAAARAAQSAPKEPPKRPHRRTGAPPSKSRPADEAERPADNSEKSAGQTAKSAASRAPTRGRPRSRTAPHPTVPNQEAPPTPSDPTRPTATSTGRPARASFFGIEPGDERHGVAKLLATRYRYRDVTAAQWETLAEVVDNEFPIGTAAGRDRHAAWGWLGDLMAELPRDAGDPIEAALAEVNRRIAERKSAADAEEVAHRERTASGAGPIAAELAQRMANGSAGTNGHAARLTREQLIEQFRTYRGSVDDALLEPQLARHGLTIADLEEPVDFGAGAGHE